MAAAAADPAAGGAVAQVVRALRTLDTEGTGEIALDALLKFLQRLDTWWDKDKVHVLAAGAGLISEHGHIRYVDFVDWVLAPGSVAATPRRPGSRGVPVTSRPTSSAGRAFSSVTVRFVHINDVYDLSHFPSLRTAVKALSCADDADRVLTTMGGDFLAPYLLSSLDHGRGMIECMNLLSTSHCCFGNHECDVPHESLLRAINDFQGKWLNSNMKGGGFGENDRLPTHDIIEVVSADGKHRRRIGLLGLLCDYPYLYREGVFNGAVPSIENVNTSCERLCEELRTKHGCDAVVPLTHQNSPEDSELALRAHGLGVPVILGGHDHNEVCERFDSPDGRGSCYLVKAGMDAEKMGVVDLIWDSPSDEWPRVEARLLEPGDFDHDADMAELVEKHMLKVHALDHMIACRRSDMEELAPQGAQFPLSSGHTREAESSMATLLCTALRNALEADVAMLEGGTVRAGSNKYEERITMSDLKAELPFKNETLVVKMPGSVLSDAVRTSREKAREKGKYAFFLHLDRDCEVDQETLEVVKVVGQDLDPDKLYSVALVIDLGIGSGVNEPLMRWAATAGDAIPDQEFAVPAAQALDVYFLRRLWKHLPSFEEIDTGRDGYLTCDEIRDAYTSVFFPGSGKLGTTQKMAIAMMVEHLTRVLDKAGDSQVSREEYDEWKSRGTLVRIGPTEQFTE